MNSNYLADPKNLVIPIILCGGSGTRLWPLSRADLPKQFLSLSENDAHHSLFQQAITRANAIGEKYLNHDRNHEVVLGPTIVVTNEEHRFLVLDQLSVSNDIDTILLLEPAGRNTAPALTLAALQATTLESVKSKLDLDQIDPILVVTPADQAIQNQAAFKHAIQNCIKVVVADKTNRTIAMLGIMPTLPETGYGYIKRNHEQGIYDEYAVDQFVEKPNVELAKKYLQDGSYSWNSGIFVTRASTWLAAIHEFRPDILIGAQDAWQSRLIDRIENAEFVRPSADIFKTIPADSIDYAVIEKCPHSMNYHVKMVELDAGWNDLGAWDAVWQEGHKNHQGNVMIGDVIVEESKNSLLYSSTRLLGVVGVEDLIVIETADAVLVANRKNTQAVKQLVSQLEKSGRHEKNLHRKVLRPWGWYDSVDEGERFKVKRILVKPGAKLSLQSHRFRAEHWIVVHGRAKITNGNQTSILEENQSTYIPPGQIHRLANPGTIPLEIIEVQSGSYLGEDDIVRLDDQYGRT